MILSKIILLAAAAVGVSAHEKRTPEQVTEYHQQVARNSEALAQCLDTPELKELISRIGEERQEAFRHLRKARGINVQPRDKAALEKWHNIDHDETTNGKGTDYKNDDKLFGFDWNDANKNVNPAVCILTPESIWGPFFADREAYRQDIREDQKGVYQRLALQVIDIATCKPLAGARVDVWQANATGVYARQIRDWAPNTNAHWLTGAQSTSSWGTVDFDTIFPGHYGGRAVHTHLSVRPKKKFNDADGFVHKGQIYYDEYPRQEIDKIEPYSSNQQDLVLTMDDAWAQAQATDKVDPFARWAWLDGSNHQAGLVTWVTVGVNSSAHVKNHDGQ